MGTKLNQFFSTLARRAYNENRLSDITYALCESNLSFKQFFLDFFFPNVLNAENTVIEREHPDELGRPDFWIRHGDTLYIVEVKIWDGNHHFEQYSKILNEKSPEKDTGKRLGYIANYEISNPPCPCRVHTWKDFAEKLRLYQCLNDQAVQGYYIYLTQVCPFDDFSLDGKEIALSSFEKVYNFNVQISNAINEIEIPDIDMELYTRSSRKFVSKQKMGQFFEFNYKEERVWGWLGIKYTNDGAILAVEFENRNGWGKPICDEFDCKNEVLQFFYHGEIKEDIDVPRFFKDVIEYVSSNNHSIANSILQDEKSATKIEELLIMKSFPFSLEQLFSKNKFVIAKYEASISHGSDEETPNKHCGRYFQLKTAANDSQCNETTGWIGVKYDNGNPRLVIEIKKEFFYDMNDEDMQKAGWRDTSVIWKEKDITKSVFNTDRLRLKANDMIKKIEKCFCI